MGEIYDTECRLNPTPVVMNYGPPIVVVGWFILWISLNYIHVMIEPNSVMYLPLYFSIRTVLSYGGASLIVLVIWMIFYAMDEYPEYDAVAGTLSSSEQPCVPAYGIAGRYFGYLWEVKVGLTAAWFIFAISAFLPDLEIIDGLWSLLLFAVTTSMGFVLAQWHELGLRDANWSAWKLWGKISGAVALAMVLLLSFHHPRHAYDDIGFSGHVLILALLGVLTAVEGLYRIHIDRKRGLHWMQTSHVNPNPIVYSAGPPTFTLGILLLAWSMSIP